MFSCGRAWSNAALLIASVSVNCLVAPVSVTANTAVPCPQPPVSPHCPEAGHNSWRTPGSSKYRECRFKDTWRTSIWRSHLGHHLGVLEGGGPVPVVELLQTLLPGPRVRRVPRHVPGQRGVAGVERGGQRGHGVAAGEAPQLRLCHGIVWFNHKPQTLDFLLTFS